MVTLCDLRDALETEASFTMLGVGSREINKNLAFYHEEMPCTSGNVDFFVHTMKNSGLTQIVISRAPLRHVLPLSKFKPS